MSVLDIQIIDDDLINAAAIEEAAIAVEENKKRAPLQMILLKIAEFCNLNCDYCFMFNLNDFSYKKKPKKMTLDVIRAAGANAARVARIQETAYITFSLHGGEPTIIGRDWIREAVAILREYESEDLRIDIYMQTNGVVIDQAWIDFARELNIFIGVSMDGTRESHDKHRVDHKGRGSYDRVVRSLSLLTKEEDIFTGTLTVMDPEVSGLEVYQSLRAIGIEAMDFLWPLDYNWDNLPPGFSDPGVTRFADYLIPIFDAWWEEDNPNIQIRHFQNMIAGLLAYRSRLDAIGAPPVSIVSIDTDGGIEPVDSLRACGDGFTEMNLNILRDPIEMIYTKDLFKTTIRGKDNLCEACRICPVKDACGAGYLPHRYKSGKGFEQPSVYCKDLWKLISHISEKMADEYKAERFSLPADKQAPTIM
ncbi:radical SAM protein [Rhodanobacter sp. Col0626]|uniref:radical SAM protein n=1 Tax=Rhodanobacter sp. Col0626 TaxID=3415679 RepID=UPI003CF72CCB